MNLDDLLLFYPEQMARDPSGKLAELTAAAAEASATVTPEIDLHHSCRRRGLLGHAGWTERGALVTLFRVRYTPLPDGAVPIMGDGDQAKLVVAVKTPIPGGHAIGDPIGDLTRTGRGVTNADGLVALLAEPPGFPPAPRELPIYCQACNTEGTIDRLALIEKLRTVEHGTTTIHRCDF